jgi:transmembrane sensor
MSDEPMSEEQPVTLMEEAALWFARMRGPEADDHRVNFEAWLARGALHRQAYNRTGKIFSMGKVLASDHPAVPSSRPVLVPRRRAARALAAAGGVGLLLVIAFTASSSFLDTPRPEGAGTEPLVAGLRLDLATVAGERRVQQLPDGSVVTLAAGTRLRVRFDGDHRNLSLLEGRARFEVAHESRPFVVQANGALVTALGTVFDVGLGPRKQVSVALLEGAVEVVETDTDRKAISRRRLRPGQSVTLAPPTRPPGTLDLRSASGAGAVDGESGRAAIHDFEGVRLADLIAEANRTAARQIVLDEASLGDLRISGRFDLGDTAKLAARTAAVFSLRADMSDPSRIVLSRR